MGSDPFLAYHAYCALFFTGPVAIESVSRQQVFCRQLVEFNQLLVNPILPLA
jgi:hypothetical protein